MKTVTDKKTMHVFKKIGSIGYKRIRKASKTGVSKCSFFVIFHYITFNNYKGAKKTT